MYRDGRTHEPDDVIDLETGERVLGDGRSGNSASATGATLGFAFL
jgi:hypothetical protein